METLSTHDVPNYLQEQPIAKANISFRVYGFVQLDPEMTGEGWASIAGDPAVRVNALHELGAIKGANNVTWITSTDAGNLEDLGCANSATILPSSFLASSTTDILNEFGYSERRDPVSSCEFLSEVVNRCLGIAEGHYNLTEADSVSEKTLAGQVAAKLKKAHPNGPLDERVKQWTASQALSQSYLYRHTCLHPRPAYHSIVKMKWPRALYGQLLMENPVPSGAELKEAACHAKGKDAVKWIDEISASKAGFVDLRVLSTEEAYSGLVHQAQKSRQWMPLYEAKTLASIADVEIRSALLTDEIIVPSKHYPIPESCDPSGASVSAGLVAEAHWHALLPADYRNNHHPEMRSISTGVASWDRVLCMRAALRFAQRGMHVLSYGNGCVELALLDNEISPAIDTALHLDMVAPMALLEGL